MHGQKRRLRKTKQRNPTSTPRKRTPRQILFLLPDGKETHHHTGDIVSHVATTVPSDTGTGKILEKIGRGNKNDTRGPKCMTGETGGTACGKTREHRGRGIKKPVVGVTA